MTEKPVLEVDGARFDDLEGFWTEFSRHLAQGVSWGRNLDAFNDVLRGGFGTPEGGFVLRWRNAARSRQRLGHEETVRHYQRGLPRVHPDNSAEWRRRLALAEAGDGPTLFDWILEILRAHGPGGDEAGDGVELELVE